MEIYSPAEDSFFLSEFIQKIIKRKEIKILDMGSGSGIQAQTCIVSGALPANLTLVDINQDAIKHLKIKFPLSKIIHSDLFEKIPNGSKYDLIIFNPPYLPKNKFDKQEDTTGGKKGDEVIIKFLKKLKDYLNEDGIALLLLSSLTPMSGIKKEFRRYKTKLLGTKKLFFEELYVWKIIS